MKVTVLGCGLVGQAIARDLAEDSRFEVLAVDAGQAALDRLGSEFSGERRAVDVCDDAALHSVTGDAELIVGALPGDLGYGVLARLLPLGKPIVDISFFAEDAFTLDALAKQHGTVAVVDMGFAPGLPNIVAGRLQAEWDEVTHFEYYVGGLPMVRKLPFEYSLSWSPIDVIAEYTRPARTMAHGRLVTPPALSDRELIDFPGLGTLEAFNTDGLRTLLRTLHCPNMLEKTLRYPGHARLMEILRDAGFFSEQPRNVNGTSVRPIDVTADLLFEQWRMQPGEEDMSVMRILVEGRKDDERQVADLYMLAWYDTERDLTSMARATGYSCTAAVRTIAEGSYTQPGISPPEYLGADQTAHDRFFGYLSHKGITLQPMAEHPAQR